MLHITSYINFKYIVACFYHEGQLPVHFRAALRFLCGTWRRQLVCSCCWLLQACYLRQRRDLCEMPFVLPGVFGVLFCVSRGSDHSVCSHALWWIQRAVLADWAAPAAVGPVQCTAGDEAYLLKLPHHPSIAMADDQQQPGQKPASGLGSLPALVPGLQGPEANALQFKIKNSIW